MIRPLIVAAALVAAAPAFAYDLPRFDVNNGWCEYVGTLGGGHPEYRHVCIEKEQQAYEELKSEWPDATEEEQDHSLRIVRAGNYHGGSYEALEAYLKGYHNMHLNMEKLKQMKQRNQFTPD